MDKSFFYHVELKANLAHTFFKKLPKCKFIMHKFVCTSCYYIIVIYHINVCIKWLRESKFILKHLTWEQLTKRKLFSKKNIF